MGGLGGLRGPAGELVFSGEPSGPSLAGLFHVEHLFGECGGEPALAVFHVEQGFIGARVVKGEKRRQGIARLRLEAGEVDGAPQKTAGRTRFEARELDSRLCKGAREGFCGEITHAAALGTRITDVHKGPEEGPSGDDHGAGLEADAQLRLHPAHLAIPVPKPSDEPLKHREVGGQLQRVFHAELVGLFVALGPASLYGRTFGGVEEAKLNGGKVGIEGHFATEGIYFADDVPFGEATDRRIAGHLGDRVDITGQKKGVRTEAGGGESRFAAGMAGATDDDVERFREGHDAGWRGTG